MFLLAKKQNAKNATDWPTKKKKKENGERNSCMLLSNVLNVAAFSTF